ncbi:MAG: hypothetical protein ACREA0_09990, partial [bacterium]
IVKPPAPTITDSRIDLLPFEAILALTAGLFPLDQLEPPAAKLWPYEKWDWRTANAPTDTRLRLIEHVRTLYRRDDLAGPLALGQVESLALPFESYKLALTPGLLAHVFKRKRAGQPDEDLLPIPAPLLEGKGADQGGYIDIDGNWWIPTGRVFYSDNPNHTAERGEAQAHFFLPHRYRDPFGHDTLVIYDGPADPNAPRYDLLVIRTTDALGNTITATNDYRVLQPRLVTDPNRNRTQVAFDTLGMVAGTAVMGKATETLGDVLDATFEPDLTQAQLDAFMTEPREATANPNESVATQIVHDLLRKATTRIVYDLDRFKRLGEPPFAATITRETHVSALASAQTSKLQISFSYSDGFGREIQKKIQAERGPLVEGGPTVSPRWVGSGWTVFNNKGKPVRQYEPFFSQLPAKRHQFEFGVQVGVSPILFYDPVERVVATLHPNHTWEKVVFDPWRQETWDVSDTVTLDPWSDEDVKGFFVKPDGTPLLPTADYLPTWHALRTDPAHAAEANQRWPDPKRREAKKGAAEKAAVHEKTPTVAHADSLGRTFLTVAHNRFKHSDTPAAAPPAEEFYATRVLLDIEGNQREVIDAKDRVVMRYDYDMLGNRIHQASMEAGERWMLSDVA